ncbi:MAG: 4-hydroxy-tetrahydrodipicolinate synthase [Actinomycetes bacterium]
MSDPRPGRFGAVLCAMATPFDGDGRLDLDGAAVLARWLVDHGNDGLVLSGTTGESPVLTDEEKRDLWRAVTEAVTVPVLAGTSTSDTEHSVALTRAAVDAGVTGILAVTPYYSRPPQAGIEGHFRAIGEAAGGLPMLVYDIPVRTGRRIAPEVMWRLATDGVIVGVKDATADPAGAAALVAGAPGGFELYSGNDGDTLPLLAVGAIGVISVESHWAGELLGEMVTAFMKGDVAHARGVNARLLDSHRFQSGDAAPNPIPTKAVLRALGLPGGQCRLPLGPASPETDAAAARLLSQLPVSTEHGSRG